MSKPKILHIAKDEKFINAAYYLFEKAFPGENKFVIIKPPADPPVRFLDDNLMMHAQFEIRSIPTVQKLVAMTSRYQVIVLHGLDKISAIVFSKSPHKNRFMTIIYGAEIYNGSIMGTDFIGPQTKKLYEETERRTSIDLLKDVYRRIKYRNHESLPDIDIKKVLYEMNVFGAMPDFSYEQYVANNIYNPSINRVPFTYYPIEFMIKNEALRAKGSDILIGNSASATNNHLEIFELLKNLELGTRKLFIPLSYGRKKYASAVAARGNELFPSHFIPLTTFLPLAEYNRIISQCGIVIMNHYRPQALGNIIISLYMGAKVFLNKTALYSYFKNLGCHIYLIQKDLIFAQDALQLLSDRQVRENREILHEKLSTSFLVEEMRRSFNELFDYNSLTREVI
jgi:hypothetical protein